MSLDENNQNKADITEFIKSLQTDSPVPPQENVEEFPFSDTFDIDAFASQDNHPLERTLTSLKPLEEDNAAPVSNAQEHEVKAEAFPDSLVSDDDDAFNISFHSDLKDQSVKHLEEKIAELQSRFDDANQQKSINSYLSEELKDEHEETKFIPSVKSNDEFFQNISSTIENLKGSLENIVTSRLQYEESLIRQDQTLITRLREKTSRLKAINLALNSEVKRAKNEKLESLRKSAEQTKELLSVRMQLSKVEERVRHGDLKLSQLEQQRASINEEKLSLENEIRRLRQEKLDSIRKSAEHTKEIMALRLELSKTEEQFKQEEIQSIYLNDQIKQLKDQLSALDNEIYSSRSQRQEADRKASEYERKIEDLNFQLSRANDGLKQQAEAAGGLREKLLSLEAELQRTSNEKASLHIKIDENLKQLEALRAEHERQIANLKAAQVQELEVIKNQKAQESQAITLELRRAEDKFRQEETFVKTLQLQIESLKGDIQKLDEERNQLKGKSTDLAREIEFIKEGHNREIDNLKRELVSAQEKFERETSSYSNLSKQYAQLEQEKNNLNEEIRKILVSKDEALEQNNRYRAEIESLKNEHSSVLSSLREDLSKAQQKHQQDLAFAKQDYTKELSVISDNFNRERYALKIELEDIKTVTSAQKDEIAKQFETFKNASEQERQNFLSQIAALKEASAKEASKYVEEIKALQANALKDAQNFAAQISELQQASAMMQERHKTELASVSAQAQQRIELNLLNSAKSQAALQESESIINALKQQISLLDNEKLLIDSELKKTAAERFEILKSLEQKARETDAFQQKYEREIVALKEEKDRQATAYQAKLDDAAQRLSQEEETVNQLRIKISSLEQEKASFERNADSVRNESLLNARKVTFQTDEILSLKAQLAKAETRFLQDSVLISQLKEQFTGTEGSRNLLDNQIKQLRDENAEVRKEIAAREEEILTLKDSLSKTQEQLKQQESAVQHLQEHTSKLKAVNFALDREVKKAQSEKLDALRKSAEQAQEILMLREQLSKAGSGAQTLDFSEGIISVRKEYEAKVEKLETELKDASALCAKQVREIQDLKTDNTRLKTAEEEKIQLEARLSDITAKAESLEGELANYKNKDADTAAFTLAKARAAALTAQISKISREKLALEEQLSAMQQTIAALTEKEKESTAAFAALKEQISSNDGVIEKLKKAIVVLTSENKELKAAAQTSAVRQQVLEAKINEIESENKKLSTISSARLAQQSADIKERTLSSAAQTAHDINRAVRTVNAVGPVVNKAAVNAAEKTNPALAKTNPSLAQTNPALTKTNTVTKAAQPAQTAVKTQAAAQAAAKTNPALTRTNITQAPVAAALKTQSGTQPKPAAKGQGQDNDPLQKSILDYPESHDSLEVVDVESEEMDLSLIFNEKAIGEDKAATTKTGLATTPSMQTLKTTTIKPMTLKTGPIPSAEQTTRVAIPAATDAHDVPHEDIELMDHSAEGFHGVDRRPIARVPNYRESEAYSDFLKKTKSVFFRIKWSLFKE